jgi:hypothetical protein
VTVSLPIQRLRLETDRMLRSRAFFARAVVGRLHDGEYAALLNQLMALVHAIAPERAHELVALGRDDVGLLEREPGEADDPPCPTIGLVKGAMQERLPRLTRSAAHDLVLVVVGTSWVVDAARTLARPFPRSTRLLRRLAAQSATSLERLTPALSAPTEEVQDHFAFAEFMRGSMLGVSTYLDARWPAPCVHHPFGGDP